MRLSIIKWRPCNETASRHLHIHSNPLTAKATEESETKPITTSGTAYCGCIVGSHPKDIEGATPPLILLRGLPFCFLLLLLLWLLEVGSLQRASSFVACKKPNKSKKQCRGGFFVFGSAAVLLAICSFLDLMSHDPYDEPAKVRSE